VFARDLFGVARITQGENVPIEPNEVGGLADFDRAACRCGFNMRAPAALMALTGYVLD
jgi:hypothetical protein